EHLHFDPVHLVDFGRMTAAFANGRVRRDHISGLEEELGRTRGGGAGRSKPNPSRPGGYFVLVVFETKNPRVKGGASRGIRDSDDSHHGRDDDRSGIHTIPPYFSEGFSHLPASGTV